MAPDPATHKCSVETCDYTEAETGRIVCDRTKGGCGRVWRYEQAPEHSDGRGKIGAQGWIPDPPPIGAARSPRRDRR